MGKRTTRVTKITLKRILIVHSYTRSALEIASHNQLCGYDILDLFYAL